jgi:hypothetical protein
MENQKLICHVIIYIYHVAIDLKQRFIDMKVSNSAIQVKNKDAIKSKVT